MFAKSLERSEFLIIRFAEFKILTPDTVGIKVRLAVQIFSRRLQD